MSVEADQATTTGSIETQTSHYKPVLRVLVACERSGRVRQAFRDRGHDAWSCDLEPADDGSPFHLQGDALPLLALPWDLLIAHPPCTHLSMMSRCRPRDESLKEAAAGFAAKFFDSSIPCVAVENPEGDLRRLMGEPSQIIQPYQFGHPFTKKTLLWIRGLPPLFTTCLVTPTKGWVTSIPGKGHKGAIERAATFQGIADAMAVQWG